MKTKPQRIRLSRAKGFNLQDTSASLNGLPVINVARPGKWGNPFVVGQDGTAAECADSYKALMAGFLCVSGPASTDDQIKVREHVAGHIKSLRGKNLACWCHADKPCHADVLLEIANAEVSDAADL